MKVTNYPYDVYLPKNPGTSLIEIVTPNRDVLNQKEDIIENDPYTKDPELWKGWNAFSGSGDVTAEVVYANYGRKEDFETLKSLGIDVNGKIVIARYGGNFRGYKAKFAEANGASGLIIYTDPQDSGFTKGLVYPNGPYYNSSTIQRGSLLTTDFTGDPLTPFEPALPLDGKEKIERIDPENAQLHTIPVSPIGYGEAEKILQAAEAYKKEVVAKAEGEASRFIAIYNEYKNAKAVTQERMYLETMEKVLADIDKVIIEKNAGSGVVPYLPLPELKKKATN